MISEIFSSEMKKEFEMSMLGELTFSLGLQVSQSDKGISEDLLESLNLMEAGDISHKKFAQIGDMCKNYSRSRGKVGKTFGSLILEM